MTPLDVGLPALIVLGLAGLALHHRFWRARQARIRTEAEAYGGRRDGG